MHDMTDVLAEHMYNVIRDEIGHGTVRTAELLARPGGPPSWVRDEAMPWCAFGSFPLYLHGIRKEYSDIDLFVAPELWQRMVHGWSVRLPDPAHPPFLTRTFVGGVEVNAFYAWRADEPEVDATICRRQAAFVHDMPCAPLALIREHKAVTLERYPDSARHAKHRADVAAIDAFVAAGF